MASNRVKVSVCLSLLLSLLLWLASDLVPEPAWAQEGEGETDEEVQPADAGARLWITAADASSMPVITLRAYGLAADGEPLDLAATPLVVEHGGQTIDEVEAGQPVAVGTFTVFLIDATGGVGDQIPAIQQAIEEFATSDYMQEQVDYVAIYRVGAEGAESVLPTTAFYNSVRNFFATPLAPQEGPTALYDSVVSLLNDMDALKPDPAVTPAVIVFSDGTDAVSTQYEADEVATRAAELGIPLHTVWLENQDLSFGREAGRNYLAETAAGAYGVAARIDQPASLTNIFSRIATLSSQRLLHYTVLEPAGGTVPVTLAMAGDPTVADETSVTVDSAMPIVTFTVPPESTIISLPDLEEPVTLSFSADVSWLDGVERSLEQARLLVNGQEVGTVPVDELESFEVTIDNLIFGDNQVRISVADEQGLQARSPALVLTVTEGETAIPEALQPSSSLLVTAGPICLGALLLLAIFGLGGFFVYRSGRLPSLGRPRRGFKPEAPAEAEVGPVPVPPVGATSPAATPAGPAYLEVVETETAIPGRISLEAEEVRLGRSPGLADIAFEQDLTVSRLHATLIWDGHVYRIYDDESTSGTYVNDQQVGDYGLQLFDGDHIYLGKVHLRFHHR